MLARRMRLKLLALFPSLSISGGEYMSVPRASVKIYVENASNLSRFSFANVIKSLLIDLINSRSWWMAGRRPEISKSPMVNHEL